MCTHHRGRQGRVADEDRITNSPVLAFQLPGIFSSASGLTHARDALRNDIQTAFVAAGFDLLGFGMVLPLLPIYAKQFSTDTTGVTIGLLMSSFSAMQFLFATAALLAR